MKGNAWEKQIIVPSMGYSPLLGHPDRERVIAQHVGQLFSGQSQIRWCWKTLSFYRIADRNLYDRRVAAFSAMYDRFYKGKRKYGATSDHQYDIFDYPDHKITFAAFNSCHNNDPYNRVGCIHPDAIAHATHDLAASRFDGRILCAVWHHNMSGSPYSFDYMDADTVQVMIDSGFSLAFHGHQHRADFVNERFRFGSDRKITIVSAGTLCGGQAALPSGVPRSYNIVELDVDSHRGKVHTRYMGNNDFSSPVWTASTGAPSKEFNLQPALERRRPSLSRLANAEALIAAKDFASAKIILQPLAGLNDIARRLLFECYLNLEIDDDFEVTFYPPSSDMEFLMMADALWQKGSRDRLAILLELDFVKNNASRAVIEIRDKYIARLKVK